MGGLRVKHHVDLIIAHASELITCSGPSTGVRGGDLLSLCPISDGAVAVAQGKIVDTGTTVEILARYDAVDIHDVSGCLVSPSLIDSHTHLIHAGERDQEFDARATNRLAGGISTGGIAETGQKTSSAQDAELLAKAEAALDNMLLHGTGLVEAKTGYGDNMETELRLLELTRRLNGRNGTEVVPTFLGAHIPPKGDRVAFVDAVIAAIPKAAKLSEFCDIACDPVCFDFDEADRIAAAAVQHGMQLRIHADQAGPWRGLELAAKWRAASADHADYASADDLRALARSGTVVTLLPGSNFHMLEMTAKVMEDSLVPAVKPHLPLLGARILQSGCVPAVATNYNPGSSPCLSMQMMMQLLPRLFRLGSSAAWYMATLNAAASLRRGETTGSLQPGKAADIAVWHVPRHGLVVERFGMNHIRDVWLGGQRVVADGMLIDQNNSLDWRSNG